MKTRDKLIVFLLSTYLLITLLMTTFIPSMSDPFNYDYFDLDNGQMPPISSECNYGLTDGLVMTKSLENTTDSAFYFKPILSNEECFLRLHSTSTPQGKYISEENVTINYGYSFLKGRNTFLILYTLIFLFITNKLKLKENHQESFSIIPYVLSIPIFIYESFYITNILIYCLCLYLIKIRSVRIKIEDLSTILILSILFPLALYQSHVSIWFMFLISFINKESFKNIYIAIGSFFLIISSFTLNKLLSIEVLNNHYFNNLYSFVYNNNVKAHIFVSWLHPFKEHRLIVIGSKGMLRYEDSSQNKELIFYDKGVNWENGIPIKKDGESKVVSFDKKMPLTEELSYFINNLDTNFDISNGKSGLSVVKILEKSSLTLEKTNEK